LTDHAVEALGAVFACENHGSHAPILGCVPPDSRGLVLVFQDTPGHSSSHKVQLNCPIALSIAHRPAYNFS